MTIPYDAAPDRFHVQTTAADQRDGFPWFAHHQAVSALWEAKWRKPCAAGLYPFTDAAVEDFDPIFADLVARSGDDAAILYRPDDYAEAFLAPAERLVALGHDALARDRPAEARALFLRAAAVYRIARFPVVRSPLGRRAWELGKAAYELGGALMDPPNVPVDIPFAHANPTAGDEEAPIKAYLRVPSGDAPDGGWPVLLFICGLDAYRTDNTTRIDEHLRRGFATLMFEIPGTGDCPAAPGDPKAPDRLMESVLDWVAADAGTHGLDAGRVVARAISTGGYYAFRVAHTHADRLLAVAEQGGGCHHMFDPRWIAAQDRMEYPFALAEALAWKFGFRNADPAAAVAHYKAEGRKFSLLDAGLLGRPSCRLLVCNGMEDSIFPIEDSFVVAARGKAKDLIIKGDRGHMGNPEGEKLVPEWLDAAVAAER